jgi:hypothetical protein
MKIHAHKNSPLVHILSQTHPVHTLPPNFHLRSSQTLFSRLRLGLPSDLFPSRFPIKLLYAFLMSPMRATYPAQLCDLTPPPIIFGEPYKLRREKNAESNN